MKIGVIGAGAWGTALAIVSANSGNDVVLWSYDGEYKHFEDIDFPQNIKISREMSDLTDADTWLIVTPAAYFRSTLSVAAQFYNGQPIIICTKGAESSTGKFMSEVLRDVLPQCENFGVLSGPQFAAEVARGCPTGSTLAGNYVAISAGQAALSKLYLTPTSDIVGAEICGVGKNAASLISGYNTVAASGENERALIFTRVWNEVVDLGLASGADVRTFLGLCGVGDLFLSATSPTSRNFSGGMSIARGEAPLGTVEGIYALSGLIERAKTLGVSTPVLCEMKEKLNI